MSALYDNDSWRIRAFVAKFYFPEQAQDYTVHFDEREMSISVLGYREINEEVEEYFLNEDRTISIPVPPLHGLFILKLLSWDKKKPDRNKDLRDLVHILYNYWEFVEEEAYEKHLDLFDDDFEMGQAAARILGRHLQKTLDKSEVLRDQVVRILKEQATWTHPPGLLLQKYASEKYKTLEEAKMQLDNILKGFYDQFDN